MSEQKLGFGATVKSLPRAVWIANTMEIFERMSWYGMFTVLALYVTAPAETGGLGFTTEARGNIQALITFLLYFAPTPGASGIGEILTAAVMSVYVPGALVALYTLLWRIFVTYCTVVVGALIFYGWVRAGLRGLEEDSPVTASPTAGEAVS